MITNRRVWNIREIEAKKEENKKRKQLAVIEERAVLEKKSALYKQIVNGTYER